MEKKEAFPQLFVVFVVVWKSGRVKHILKILQKEPQCHITLWEGTWRDMRSKMGKGAGGRGRSP